LRAHDPPQLLARHGWRGGAHRELTGRGALGLLPALSDVEGPALSDVEGPALSDVEGLALSTVEGLALSNVEGFALSNAEGLALSNAEGREARPTGHNAIRHS